MNFPATAFHSKLPSTSKIQQEGSTFHQGQENILIHQKKKKKAKGKTTAL